MSAKNNVLKALELNIGSTLSGEQLATELNITRSAVWKAINTLKIEGYNITATTNKGYSLSVETDMLSAEGILPYLNEAHKNIEIITKKSVGSTNLEAKKLAIVGAIHGTTVISSEQTDGKGRLGRSFYSPLHTGIYMSMILKLDLATADALLITTVASVAVCRAIEKVAPELSPQIKWVNDIYINNKKVCGILTEAVTSFESGTIESIILGIGINVNTSDFPDDIKNIAGSLFLDKSVKKNHLIGEIINNVLSMAADITNVTFMEDYRDRSLVIGKELTVITPITSYTATALDVDKNGGLIIMDDTGKLNTLNSGEVSIRGDF